MRVLNKAMLTSHGNIEGRKIVAELLDAGLDALDPYYRVKALIRVEDNKIFLDSEGFEMRGDPHAGPVVLDLKDYDRVFVIGAAKGVQRAALAMEEVLGDVLTAGHVIGKHGDGILCKKIGVTLAGHPVPDAYCIEGCKKIEALAKDITERDLVFTIFGSGCSSLMTYPAGDITLEDVANEVFLSKAYLSSIFKQETGMSIINYINQARVAHSKKLLATTSMSLIDIANECSFGDQSYFSRVFKRYEGVSPKQYRSSIIKHG